MSEKRTVIADVPNGYGPLEMAKIVLFREPCYETCPWISGADLVRSAFRMKQVTKLFFENIFFRTDSDIFETVFVTGNVRPKPVRFSLLQILKLIKTNMNTKKILGFDIAELCSVNKHLTSNFLTSNPCFKPMS